MLVLLSNCPKSQGTAWAATNHLGRAVLEGRRKLKP